MGPGSGLALDGGGARAVVLTLGSVLNVKQLLLKSLLLFLLNVKTQKQCFSVNVEQLYLYFMFIRPRPHKRNENYGNIKRVKIRLAVSNSVRHTDNTIHANAQ